MKSAILTGKHCRSNLRPTRVRGLGYIFRRYTTHSTFDCQCHTHKGHNTVLSRIISNKPYPQRQYQYIAITNHLTTTLITAINSNDALSHSFVTCTPICSIFNALHHFLDCLLIGIGYPLLKRVMLARFMCQMSGYDGLSVASGIHGLISDEEEVVVGLGP